MYSKVIYWNWFVFFDLISYLQLLNFFINIYQWTQKKLFSTLDL